MATLATNLDPRAGIHQRLANVIVAELGDLINGSDPYLIPVRFVVDVPTNVGNILLTLDFTFSFEKLSRRRQVDYVQEDQRVRGCWIAQLRSTS